MKNLPTSALTKNQTKMFSKTCKIDGRNRLVEVTIRYDDRCGNGYNTFSITGDVHVNTKPTPSQRDNTHCCGCIHDTISEFFPELRGYIKWHLCSSNGPMHYLANTLYLAGDTDYNGLRQGERRQLINGQTRVGEGKEPDLDGARGAAIWPDATLEQLQDKQQLTARLPGVMDDFKLQVESLGFVY